VKAVKVYTKILVILLVGLLTGFDAFVAVGGNTLPQNKKIAPPELTLEEKVGQLIWLEIDDHTQNLSGLLKKYHPAGIVIHSTDPIKIRRWSEIAASSGKKSRILVDNDVTLIQDISLFPDNNSIKNISDTSIIEKYHTATRQQMSILGIDRAEHYGIDLGLNLAKAPGHVEILKKYLFESDGIMLSKNMAFWYGEIYRMVKTGEIPASYIESKVDKILAVKEHIKPRDPIADPSQDYLLPYQLNAPEDMALIEVLYQHSFVQFKNSRNIIPIQDITKSKLMYLSQSSGKTTFGTMLKRYYPVESCRYTTLKGLDIQNLDDYKYIFLDLSGILSREDIEALHTLDEEFDLIVSYFGKPRELAKLKSLSTVLWHPENKTFTQAIAPQILFGGLSISDKNTSEFRLSYMLPENAGMDSHSLTRIDGIITELLNNKATPGCQVLVARNGKVVYDKSFGSLFYHDSLEVTSETLYDLASVTKVLATLPALMYLDQEGLLDIDQRLSNYIPELRGTDKEDVIIRDVLVHQAGLYPYLPFWRQSVNEEGLIPELYSQEQQNEEWKLVSTGLYSNESLQDSLWKWTVESRMRKLRNHNKEYDYKYSDLGFYMLKELVERISGMTLDQFSKQYLYDPLGLGHLTFLPASKFDLETIAPTEVDTYFRKALIHGTVHDQTAAMFGGVAGHAGLFGNANDLAKMMQMFLWNGHYAGISYFEEQTVNKYIKKQNSENRRGLGWDKPDPEGEGNTSPYASLSSFGHTGFTGTSVWADPEYGLIYIFLSNRVHPNANNNRLSRGNYRIRIQDAIYHSVQEYEKSHSY